MKVKIKDSLNIKVFLWIFSALVLCCLIIYGSILFFLPRSYEMILSTHIESEIGNLSEMQILLERYAYSEISGTFILI